MGDGFLATFEGPARATRCGCARVAALAGPAEVVVSRTVTDLVAGSGVGFED
jgi:class 3 adenylate cyclase